MCLKNSNGFTLIELLVAMTLSAVIMVILFAAMRLGYKSQEKGTAKSEDSQKVRILADRVSWLIRGAYPFFVRKEDESRIYFDGRSDRLGFVTTSIDTHGKGPEDTAGLKWVMIFTDNEGLKIREKVFFLEDVFEDKNGKVYLLDPDVKKIAFEFYDLPEGEKQGSWVSEWAPSEKEVIPSAVRVKMTLERNGRKIEVPELMIHVITPGSHKG